jgi:hypothetical protein
MRVGDRSGRSVSGTIKASTASATATAAAVGGALRTSTACGHPAEPPHDGNHTQQRALDCLPGRVHVARIRQPAEQTLDVGHSHAAEDGWQVRRALVAHG